MKLNRFLIAASAIVLAAACAKEQDVNVETPIEENLIKATIRATADELSAETKTSLASNGSLYWTYDDHITVFDGYGNRDFDSSLSPSAEPTKEAYFEGEINAAAVSFAAVYPYNSSATYSESKITTELPTTQYAVANSFANKSNVAVATGTPGDAGNLIDGTNAIIHFSFQNVGALLKFTLSQDDVHQSVTVRAFTKAGEVKTFTPIAGEIKVDPSTGVAETTANSENDVIVTPSSGKLAAGSYYAVVLPIDTKYIQFEFSNGISTKVRNTSKAISVARSSYFDMGTIDAGITYPDPLLGDYIIASKGTSGYWVVMSTSLVDGRTDRWQYAVTTNAFDKSVNLTDSSVDFGPWSYNTYKFSVEAKDGGYVLKNSVSGQYVTYAGSGNAGKEVALGDVVKFDTFNKDDVTGVWTMGVKSGSDLFTLEYNANAGNNYFSFYKGTQQDIYLIPYVFVAPVHNLEVSATTVTLAGIAGRTETIDVTSNYAWTAVLDGGASGFMVTPSGDGNGTITITASANGSSTEQTLGSFTVSDGEDDIVVTVKQAAYVSLLTDVLTSSWAGTTTGSSYSTWNNKAGSASDAIYAGNTNHGVAYIQLRSNTPSGIVTTTSGGLVRRVEVDYSSTQSNTNARYITIYGSHEAFESGDNPSGTSLGTITFNTGDTTEGIDITQDFEYIGIKANGAIYFDEIRISWAPKTKYDITIDGGITNGSVVASANRAIEGATITLTPSPASGYAFDSWDVYKTGETSTKVTVTSNQFTMPAYGVTVSANFVAIPTISMNTTTITSVVAAGVSSTATSAYSLLNGAINGDVTITCDGTVVTAASKNATAGSIDYTVSENTGAARDGWIKVKYGTEDAHDITVSQVAAKYQITLVAPGAGYSIKATVDDEDVATSTTTNATAEVEYGKVVTISATTIPDDKVFSSWTVTGATKSGDTNPATFTVESSAVSITAGFSDKSAGPDDNSANYSGNVTLATTGGSNASKCKISISDVSYDGIKAGTGSNAGAVRITVPSGTKYLHLHVAGWNNESVVLSVTPTGYSSNIKLTSNSGISSNTPFTFNGEANTSDYYKVITFNTALTSDTNLTFTASSGKRFVVWGVTAQAE